MITFLLGGIILTPEKKLSDTAVKIEQGKIKGLIAQSEIRKHKNHEIIHLDGGYITPGLIDLHVHGSKNADTMDASYDSLNTMSLFFAEHGVTSFLATTLSASKEDIIKSLMAINSFKNTLEGANLLGAHIEGPFININYKGAQSPQHLRFAESDEYKQWFEIGCAKLITIAPELKGSDQFINYGINQGAEFAIGHSKASYEQVIHAADLGVRQSTHTFNGMQGLHHREPGTAGGILTDDRIYAQIIVDGIHVHPAMVKLLVRSKGIERTILVTDAIRATGLANGEYTLGDAKVTVKSGVARIASGSLAGSTLTLDNAIRNIMRFAELDFQDAIRMATSVPADAMNINDSKGYIKPGADADLTLFNEHFEVVGTLVKGKFVYKKSS